MRLNLLPSLAGLQVPTLWVRGADDPLVGAAELAAAAAAAPSSRLVTLADAGHFVTYDRPDAVVRLVREFLAETLGHWALRGKALLSVDSRLMHRVFMSRPYAVGRGSRYPTRDRSAQVMQQTAGNGHH